MTRQIDPMLKAIVDLEMVIELQTHAGRVAKSMLKEISDEYFARRSSVPKGPPKLTLVPKTGVA